MRVLEAFETSERLIAEGRECEIEFAGQIICRVWVRPADSALNSSFRREIAEQSIALRNGGLEQIEEDLDRKMLHLVYCRAVITRWEWTDPADQADPTLEFTEEKACALFVRAPKFFEAIQRAAKVWAQFRAAFEEDAGGNSPTSSITSSESGTPKSRGASPKPTRAAG